MSSIDLKLLGSKLQKCRNQLQLEIQEVSNSCGISTSRIVELEAGSKEPTGDEILILSDYYKQDYRFFISNQQQTATDQIDILYRNFGGEFSKEDRWAIQEFLYLCECEETVLQILNKPKSTFSFSSTGNFYKKHGEDAATALRKQMGYKAEQLIPDIYSEFRKIGIHVFRRRLKNSNFSGLFIQHPWAGKCILVNYDEDIFRQNFTVSHEIGHSIFDYKQALNVSLNNDKYDLKEIRANSFASNFLVPKEALIPLRTVNISQDLLIATAKRLKVNIQTLLIPLKELDLIDDIKYTQFKTIKIPKVEKEDFELSGLTDKRREIKIKLLEKGISNFYIQLCYEAYSLDKISAKRLAEMLLTEEIELPDLLSLFNLKLSYDN
jgi:Zn-dependent peptidase ImmA (M78 family)